MYSEDGWLGNRIVLVGVGSLFDWRLSMMMANVLQALHVFVIFAVLLDSSSWMNPWDKGVDNKWHAEYKGDDVSIYLAGGRIFERKRG